MFAAKKNVESENELLQSGFRFALSLTHNQHDAEDLVQQAWLTLCRRYGQVENRAILFTAVRNHFYDKCRRNKIVQFDSIDEKDEPAIGGSVDVDSSVKGDLEILLSNLSAKERELIYLNCVEGFSASEMSEQLNIPRGTILSLLSRAKKKLRTIAEREGRAAHE